MAGDWQFTTDSTCLTPRSEAIDAKMFPQEERIALVTGYYEKAKIVKEKAFVEKIVRKYGHEFAKLVSRLEQKYSVNFDFDTDPENIDAEL